MDSLKALFAPAMALETPQPSSEVAEHGPKVGAEGDIAKLRFLLLSLLQNTHPDGTSIDEVLTDARRVLGQRSIIGESSTVPLPSSTPTAIRRQLEQLLDLQLPTEDIRPRQLTPPTPTPTAMSRTTHIRGQEVGENDGALFKSASDTLFLKRDSLEENLSVKQSEENLWNILNYENLEPTRNFL